MAGLATAAVPLARVQTAPAQTAPAAPAAAPAAPTGPLNGNGFYRQRVGEMTATPVLNS